jgi:general secretion pathway protein D
MFRAALSALRFLADRSQGKRQVSALRPRTASGSPQGARRGTGTGAALAVLALLATGLTAPAHAAPLQDEEVPPIQEQGDYYILNFSEDQNNGLTLEQFVKSCEQTTGINFVISKQSAQALAQERVRMFGTKRIPKKDFYAFFQIIMFINDFACIEVGPTPLSVVVVQPIGGAGGRPNTSIRQGAVYVPPDDLDQYANQPAILITTVLTLPNLDVRNLSNSLRSMLTDTNTEQMLPAGNSDSLVLTGFGSSVWQKAQLLWLIDRESALEEPIQPVFDQVKLEFAAPEDVVDIVEQLLEAQRGGQQNQNRNPDGTPAPADIEPKLIVESRTSSIIIMAMPEDMPAIKDLIASLDSEVIEPERNYHIYVLENVAATELAETLTSFLDDARSIVSQNTQGTGGRAGNQGGGSTTNNSEDVVVVAEETTNALLIAANKTRYAEVVELIQQLDKRADQVLIETALVELTGNDFRDIGVELGLAEIGDEDGGFGVTSFGLSSLEDLDNDGIPETRVPTVTNGLTGGILSGDDFSLPFLLSLLETRNDANVLSIPSILVNNNGSATVSTQDERPTTQVSAFGQGQTQENFQGFQAAGITLGISPSISASRYLRLGIDLTVSNFVGQAQGAIPPPRATRSIITSVNVPDGDTMVIGGVITNDSTYNSQRTPWIADIPLLGALFRRDTRNEVRRTLYFFVTPHILADEDFADLAEISYQRKLEAAKVIGSSRIQMIDPSFNPMDETEDLEGFSLPFYDAPESGEVNSSEVGLNPQAQAELLEKANAGESSADVDAEALEALGYLESGNDN